MTSGLVLVALVAAAIAVVGTAPPATASVTQVFPADEDGLGVEGYSTTDAIYAIAVTQVLSGGWVCATTLNGNTCVAELVPVPAFNDANSVVPLYAPNTLNAYPQYQLIGWNPDHTVITAREPGTFSVGTAGNCNDPAPETSILDADATICQANLDAWKAAAGAFAGRSLEMAVLGTLFFAVAGVVGLAALAGGGVVGVAVAGGSAVTAVLAARVAFFASKSTLFWMDHHNDPPDPNFLTVFQPQLDSSTPPSDPVDKAYFDAMNHQAAYAEALLHAYERFQGAQAAGNAAAAHLQVAAAADFAAQLSTSVTDTVTAERAIADRSEAAGGAQNPTVSQSYLDDVTALQSRVGTSGFTPAELDQFTALGVTPADIAAARSSFAQMDTSFVTPGRSLADQERSVADETETQIGFIDQFADNLSTLADLPLHADQPPVASFTSSPSGGLAPQPVAFDAASSTDDGTIASYAWDFGDGTTATGPLASHLYSTAGSYTVQLTVTDDGGHQATATHSLVIGDVASLQLPICGDQDDGAHPAMFNCPDFALSKDAQSYRVDGSGAVDVTFDWVYRDAGNNNELAVVRLDDAAGTVDGKHPGDVGYPAAVFGRAETVFPAGSTALTPDVTKSFHGGDDLMFFIVAAGTLQQQIQNNPTNAPGGSPMSFFTNDGLDPDQVPHTLGYTNTIDGTVQFGFEDAIGGGDRDYNDVVFDVSSNVTAVPLLSTTKTVDEPTAAAGGQDGYTIKVSNSGRAGAVLSSVHDDLPSGFAYLAGSTTGATTANPSVVSGTLTWSGPLTVPANSSITLHFGVTVSSVAGQYFNQAGAAAGVLHVEPTGPTAPVTVSPPPPVRYFGLTPKRLLDSRDGTGGVSTRWTGGEHRDLVVTGGATTVPANATAVALNVTGVAPSLGTHLTVWPAGETMPLASSLNLPAGSVRPNLVIVKVGAGGAVSIFNNAGTIDVLADVVGYFAPDSSGGLYTGLTPKRLLDSRDGTGGVTTRWTGGESRALTVTGGTTTVPADATAVVLNVTVSGPSVGSHLTVWPTGTPKPVASNLNFSTGETVPNLVIAKVGANGRVSIFNNEGTVDVLADVVGYYTSATGGTFTGLSPKRLLDSRTGTGGYTTSWAGGESRTLTVRGGTTTVPAGATAVVLNVTAVGPSRGTHVTVWPAGGTMPVASNLNVPSGDTRANLVIAKIGANGQVSLFNNEGTINLIADVVGYFS